MTNAMKFTDCVRTALAITVGLIKAASSNSSGGVLNEAAIPSTVTPEVVDPIITNLTGVGKLPAFIIEENDAVTDYQSVSLPLDARVSPKGSGTKCGQINS